MTAACIYWGRHDILMYGAASFQAYWRKLVGCADGPAVIRAPHSVARCPIEDLGTQPGDTFMGYGILLRSGCFGWAVRQEPQSEYLRSWGLGLHHHLHWSPSAVTL